MRVTKRTPYELLQKGDARSIGDVKTTSKAISSQWCTPDLKDFDPMMRHWTTIAVRDYIPPFSHRGWGIEE
jgi:hypothetical protein